MLLAGRLVLCLVVSLALAGLAGLASRAEAFRVYASADGGATESVFTVTPGAGSVDVPIHFDTEGSTASGSSACSGSGSGKEACGFQLRFAASGDLRIVSFAARTGAPADYVSTNLVSDTDLRLVGGEPLAGELGSPEIGRLRLMSLGPAGEVRVVGDGHVGSDLLLGSVPNVALANACAGVAPDHDCDGLLDPSDNCPWFASADTTDANGDGIGNVCQCGDQGGIGGSGTGFQDGLLNLNDIFAVNDALLDPSLVTPLCDTNNDDQCNLLDLFGVNDAILGAQAFCSRYPSAAP